MVSELPGAIGAWCAEALGSGPVEVLFGSVRMSRVWGVGLADGRRVVIKSRDDPTGRTASVLEVQQVLALRRFPCPLPITEPVELDGWGTVNAEVWQESGTIDTDDSPAAAVRFATLLARQVSLSLDVDVAPPLPNPPWVCWDHDGDRLWPEVTYLDQREPARPVAPVVTEVAERVRARLTGHRLPAVLGHVDWETQHLRWSGGEPLVVHDWDSLAWLPEAAVAGVAAGTFTGNAEPTLAPLASSRAFLDHYQSLRRGFDDDELRVAWAAGLWVAAHNARMEAVHGRRAVAERALTEQCRERLALAGA